MILCTLWDVGWGTRGDKNGILYKVVLLLWNVMLLSGIAYSIYRLLKKGGIESTNIYLVITVSSVFGILFIGYISYHILKYRHGKRNKKIDIFDGDVYQSINMVNI
jgi:hypothetical protein